MISNTTPYQAAESYLERGWFPIYVEYKTKNPDGEHWQNRRISKENIHTRFNKKEQNVGILLGISNGLIDVDLDCPEAVELAPFFLPPTHLKGGRGERPNSHWFYCCPNFKTMQFSHGKKEDDDGMIVDIRGITSSGTPKQTLVYPSVHTSGDKYIWNESGNPAPIEQEVLIKKVKQLAAASLLARHWPNKGTRNNTAMALAGTLLRS